MNDNFLNLFEMATDNGIQSLINCEADIVVSFNDRWKVIYKNSIILKQSSYQSKLPK